MSLNVYFSPIATPITVIFTGGFIYNTYNTYGGVSSGISGLNGDNGWTPRLGIEEYADTAYFKVLDWFGSSGIKPETGLYVSSTGYTSLLAQAINIKGPSGLAGPSGVQGATGPSGSIGLTGPSGATGPSGVAGLNGSIGPNGWSPIFSLEENGSNTYIRIVNWFGGSGSLPPTGNYIGATGYADLASAINVRGPSGLAGMSLTGENVSLTTLTNIYATTGEFVWEKPANFIYGFVEQISGGGGGAAGRKGAANTSRGGGQGGWPGNYSFAWFQDSEVGPLVTGRVGYGGTGGAASISNNLGGHPGQNGQASYFGDILIGIGGVGGFSSSDNRSTSTFQTSTPSMAPLGAPSPTASTSITNYYGTNGYIGGGGAGGPITSSSGTFNGISGGCGMIPSLGLTMGGNGGSNASLATITGLHGSGCPTGVFGGGGGGGGGASILISGATTGPGGNGGLYGGPGGGGAAATNDFNFGGPGGNGAQGIVRVISYIKTEISGANPGVAYTTLDNSMYGLVEVPEAKNYLFCVRTPITGLIQGLDYKLSAGTLTGSVKINSSYVSGLYNVPISSVQGYVSGYNNNVFAIGDSISLEVAETASATDFSFVIRI